MIFSSALRWLNLLFACAFMALVLSACGATQSLIKEQTLLNLSIEASDGVNPNEKGLPSPIVVRIYELKSSTIFDNADFFSLQNDAPKVLGEDILATDEFILRPGDIQEIHRKSNPATTVIGILAGYRELGKSVWRRTYKLEIAPEATWYRMVLPANSANLRIYLDQQAISVTELD
ncbi:type VI secretion system lipoprotein TssJ [Neisseriaceae bacterium TC5R-5]|nr:type VI secretion system lipoprotein TssJ [Neisseriaceae bacterium TC5R-5]